MTKSDEYGSDQDFERWLKPRGKRLWRELSAQRLTPGQRVLAEEACRLADRLERLNAIINNSRTQWVEVVADFADDGQEITITINGVLAEARQQALALRSVLQEIRMSVKANDPSITGIGEGTSYGDQLAAKRARRLANPGNL